MAAGRETVKRIFLAACACPRAEQDAFVRGACGDDIELRSEVESFIEHDRALSAATNGLDDSGPGNWRDAAQFAGSGSGDGSPGGSSGRSQQPERVGDYRILGVLGEGGMATVYRAEQERPRRPVALKVVKLWLASAAGLKRFELESELLGRLRHPGIAQIYEAGTAETCFGRQPFFAMELVEGQALTEFAEQRGLTTRERLELLVGICDAVQHAHHRGIIHRDLKPANILVVEERAEPPREGAARWPADEPCARRGYDPAARRISAKVLDFGVARAVDLNSAATTAHTAGGQLIGTIPYMSPEQVAGDPGELDMRSDVYALGVVGFELLSGRLPYDLAARSIPDALRTIRQVEPLSLGRLDAAFRGDLDAIFCKALEKDKTRRYQTAAELAADIRRYLRHEPVSAHPPTVLYQLRKFARRHRHLAWGAATTLLALLAGMAGTTWQLVKATQERDRAREARALASQRERQAQRAAELAQRENRANRALYEFISQGLISAAQRGGTPELIDFVDALVVRAESGFGDQPGMEPPVRSTLGLAYQALGEYAQAESQLRIAYELHLAATGPLDLSTDVALWNLIRFLEAADRFEEAEPLLRERLERTRRAYGPLHIQAAAAAMELRWALEALGRPEEAARVWRPFSDATGWVIDHEEDTLHAMAALAARFSAYGEIEPAEWLFRTVLDARSDLLGRDHPDTVAAMARLGVLYREQDAAGQSEALLTEALEANRRLYGPDHRTTLLSAVDLAKTLLLGGKHQAAEALLLDCRSQSRLAPDDPVSVAIARSLAELHETRQEP